MIDAIIKVVEPVGKLALKIAVHLQPERDDFITPASITYYSSSGGDDADPVPERPAA